MGCFGFRWWVDLVDFCGFRFQFGDAAHQHAINLHGAAMHFASFRILATSFILQQLVDVNIYMFGLSHVWFC